MYEKVTPEIERMEKRDRLEQLLSDVTGQFNLYFASGPADLAQRQGQYDKIHSTLEQCIAWMAEEKDFVPSEESLQAAIRSAQQFLDSLKMSDEYLKDKKDTAGVN